MFPINSHAKQDEAETMQGCIIKYKRTQKQNIKKETHFLGPQLTEQERETRFLGSAATTWKQ